MTLTGIYCNSTQKQRRPITNTGRKTKFAEIWEQPFYTLWHGLSTQKEASRQLFEVSVVRATGNATNRTKLSPTNHRHTKVTDNKIWQSWVEFGCLQYACHKEPWPCDAESTFELPLRAILNRKELRCGARLRCVADKQASRSYEEKRPDGGVLLLLSFAFSSLLFYFAQKTLTNHRSLRGFLRHCYCASVYSRNFRFEAKWLVGAVTRFLRRGCCRRGKKKMAKERKLSSDIRNEEVFFLLRNLRDTRESAKNSFRRFGTK